MNDGTGSVILIDVKTRTDNSSGLRSSVFDLVRSQNGLRGIVDEQEILQVIPAELAERTFLPVKATALPV